MALPFDDGPYGGYGGPGGRHPALLDSPTVLGREVGLKRVLKLIKAFADSMEEEEPFTIVLSKGYAKSKSEPIHAVPFDGEKSPEEVAEEILDYAEGVIENGRFFTGVTFVVGIDGRPDNVQFPLRRAGRSMDADGFGGPEFAPGMEGAHALTMQQNTHLIDKVVDLAERLADDLKDQNRELRHENRALKEVEWHNRKLAVDLIHDLDARRMRYQEHEREQDRKDAIVKVAAAVGPPIVAGLFGPQAAQYLQAASALALSAGGDDKSSGGAGPAEGHTTDDVVDALVAEIQGDEAFAMQLQGLVMASQKPRLIALLTEMFAQSTRRREQRAQAAEVQAAVVAAASKTAPAQNGAPAAAPPPAPGAAPNPPPGYYGGR